MCAGFPCQFSTEWEWKKSKFSNENGLKRMKWSMTKWNFSVDFKHVEIFSTRCNQNFICLFALAWRSFYFLRIFKNLISKMSFRLLFELRKIILRSFGFCSFSVAFCTHVAWSVSVDDFRWQRAHIFLYEKEKNGRRKKNLHSFSILIRMRKFKENEIVFRTNVIGFLTVLWLCQNENHFVFASKSTNHHQIHAMK